MAIYLMVDQLNGVSERRIEPIRYQSGCRKDHSNHCGCAIIPHCDVQKKHSIRAQSGCRLSLQKFVAPKPWLFLGWIKCRGQSMVCNAIHFPLWCMVLIAPISVAGLIEHTIDLLFGRLYSGLWCFVFRLVLHFLFHMWIRQFLHREYNLMSSISKVPRLFGFHDPI